MFATDTLAKGPVNPICSEAKPGPGNTVAVPSVNERARIGNGTIFKVRFDDDVQTECLLHNTGVHKIVNISQPRRLRARTLRLLATSHHPQRSRINTIPSALCANTSSTLHSTLNIPKLLPQLSDRTLLNPQTLTRSPLQQSMHACMHIRTWRVPIREPKLPQADIATAAPAVSRQAQQTSTPAGPASARLPPS